jgi:hypothetical protein
MGGRTGACVYIGTRGCTQIRNFDRSFARQQNIFWLQVSVNPPCIVQGPDALQCAGEEVGGDVVRELLVLFQVKLEVTAREKLQNKVHIVFVVERRSVCGFYVFRVAGGGGVKEINVSGFG